MDIKEIIEELEERREVAESNAKTEKDALNIGFQKGRVWELNHIIALIREMK